ncbi:MAG: methyltransferase domain-containing protein [Acidimicrobiales bacterium]
MPAVRRAEHRLVFDHPDCGRVVECGSCGLRYTRSRRLSSWPDIRREQPIPLQDVFLAKQTDQIRDFRAILRTLGELGATGPLLDIGALTGHFLAEARTAGFDTVGIEPDPWAARYARDEFGLDVREELLPDAELAPGSFGVVSMLHVMEHLLQPFETLAAVHEVLRRRDLRGRDPHRRRPRDPARGPARRHYVFDHTLFLTRDTARRFLEEAGFRIVHQQATGRTCDWDASPRAWPYGLRGSARRSPAPSTACGWTRST